MNDDATRDVFLKQFAAMNVQIQAKDAKRVRRDPGSSEFAFVDADVMGAEFMRTYGDMTSVGYARGWL